MTINLWFATLRQRSRRMLAVARVESLRLVRDRTSISLILVVPAVQILLFGYAVNLEPKNITLAISRTLPVSDDWLRNSIHETGFFTVIADGLAPNAAIRSVSEGTALVAMEIGDADAKLVADMSDPAAVRPAVLALQAAILINATNAALGDAMPRISTQWLYNPDGRSAWAIAPGLTGVVVMISMLMLGALTLVREREQGSWESLLATPVDALDALVGKLAPYLLLGVTQAVIVIYVAHGVLDVPLRGAVAALLLAALLLAAAHLVLGFALSALAETQLQALQGAVFFYLPSMLLSGFMFPFSSMPRWAQGIGEALPLTHFVRTARGVLLRGESSHFVWQEMRSVVVFTVIAGTAAAIFYRRRLQ
jgi:ABC-2 type transport system permease protein